MFLAVFICIREVKACRKLTIRIAPCIQTWVTTILERIAYQTNMDCSTGQGVELVIKVPGTLNSSAGIRFSKYFALVSLANILRL